MPINRTGLPHAAASTSQTEEASTSQAQASRPLPDPLRAQIEQDERFDRLSPIPRDLRREIVRRLEPRSMARLGSTSREMAPVAREEMQAFMDRNPCYDLLTDFGEIGSGERLRAALHAVTHFPYPADQDRSEQILRRYGRLAARIPSLPRAQRFEAFTAVLNCATRYSGDMAFRVVARLTNDLGCLPEDLRALAFHAILPSLIATRRQALQAAAGAAHGGHMVAGAEADAADVQGDAAPGAQGAVAPAQGGAAGGIGGALPFNLLASAIRQLPEEAVNLAITEAAALQTGPRLLAEVTLRLHLVGLEPIHRFQQAYAQLAEHLARSGDGAEALTHLVALLDTLPDPGVRQAAFRELTRAVHALNSTESSAAVLRRLAGALPQQPAAVRYLCSLDVLAAAGSLFPSEQIPVIASVRAQAAAIPNQAAELIARCDDGIATASMMLATVSRRYMDM
ncbi:type III secretion system effector F-box protein XopI [Xanthomonas vasicola]|uniref:type III secretion system effector F-box protein XopI n=1 Tax=Xanthomonas vasicola TaxID=56459 RepID=UPI0001CC0660|nr:type III secretion system effector F-box protein XopI [Xanthomonas vasicola]KFA32018.1 type III secretion system effector protein [Xanthomonas vasicola pv. musacearum NCPPB 4384]AZR27928.1 type III secretion system effector protein XopI [Xanthomonas vasicola pv. arecae]AZR29851.1 type III secretion system effector protein XopI [Xanthomonas vasicola pv. musacearum NCPPB 4379]KFA11432.1 type III secretion system effector protein [Xanthomonas vasicola pv. musacearum NCPPB 4380]KFA12107.1 type 